MTITLHAALPLAYETLRTCHSIAAAEGWFVPEYTVSTAIKGRTAGSVRFRARRGSVRGRVDASTLEGVILRLNMTMLAKNGADAVRDTVCHEFAHIVALANWGIKGHQAAWRNACITLGGNGLTYHSYDLVEHEVRKGRRKLKVVCGCRDHDVTTLVYNRIYGGVKYQCRQCKEYVRIPG
ncbi:MAG: SprT-like domain-containing protein [Candidatus Nanopelagicales bacterium]